MTTADEVFDILVAECNAHESLREEFRHHFPSRDLEFRFSGDLGFGGKVRRSRRFVDGGVVSAFRVTCYSEDQTEERSAIIDRANTRLAALVEDS